MFLFKLQQLRFHHQWNFLLSYSKSSVTILSMTSCSLRHSSCSAAASPACCHGADEDEEEEDDDEDSSSSRSRSLWDLKQTKWWLNYKHQKSTSWQVTQEAALCFEWSSGANKTFLLWAQKWGQNPATPRCTWETEPYFYNLTSYWSVGVWQLRDRAQETLVPTGSGCIHSSKMLCKVEEKAVWEFTLSRRENTRRLF